MTKHKKTINRLQELEVQAEQRKINHEKAVIGCMTTAELKEICAMYDNENVDKRRIDEIWERVEHEYKSKTIKTD